MYDAVKAGLTQAQQRQQQAQAQADGAAQKVAETAASRKPAEEGFAKVKNVAAEKRKLAEQAKAARDKVAGDERAAAAELADAARKLDAIKAPPTPAQKQQDFRDLLWALMNTKEFLLNH